MSKIKTWRTGIAFCVTASGVGFKTAVSNKLIIQSVSLLGCITAKPVPPVCKWFHTTYKPFQLGQLVWKQGLLMYSACKFFFF